MNEKCAKRKELFKREFKNNIGMKWSFDCEDDDTILIECPIGKLEEFVMILKKFEFCCTSGMILDLNFISDYYKDLSKCYVKDKYIIGICRLGLGGKLEAISETNCIWFPHNFIRNYNVKYVCDYSTAKRKLAKIHREMREFND